MPNFNKTILMGNLVRDPEMRYVSGDTPLVTITVASNRKGGKDSSKKDHAIFLDCTCWGRTAEIVNQYTRKGSCVLVEGWLRQDQWEDKETGQKRSKIGMTVQSVEFINTTSRKRLEDPDSEPKNPVDMEDRPAADPMGGEPVPF